jgi:hypothetical protein
MLLRGRAPRLLALDDLTGQRLENRAVYKLMFLNPAQRLDRKWESTDSLASHHYITQPPVLQILLTRSSRGAALAAGGSYRPSMVEKITHAPGTWLGR